ncbi:MAG TPA: maltotransferase domain-containing protein [Lacipirellulaceae bacterium]|nr:maltotransferase domain-containing protein [Lacipirellulaceae bacterium]
MATSHAKRPQTRTAELPAGPIQDGTARVVIEKVAPQVDGGRFPIKRITGDTVQVEADVFADGHDAVAAMLLHRPEGESEWTKLPMRPLASDRWTAEFKVDQVGEHRYQVAGWVDHFATWKRNLQKRIEAGQDFATDLLIGADLIRDIASSAAGPDLERLEQLEDRLRNGADDRLVSSIFENEELDRMMLRWSAVVAAVTYSQEFPVTVDRPRAAFSAWYEMFPRSAATSGRHGTLKDVEARLPYVASMGFDVLYLPPIHPIGSAFRKGSNNAEVAHSDDVGSPWGIGSEEGGHKSIHSQLGTMADFRRLMAEAEKHGIELALDVAFQTSPDHPYVREHPEWFRKRPDGTIQYAENPPKKYQDIYPFDFETEAWQSLWQELKSIFDFWIDEGVRIFRVDNPHTKPFAFWEWVIREIRSDHRDVLFLAEAFTRPKVMYRLAKLGFSQSYTYFAWRDTKWELTQYFTEITRSEVREFFRPNLWPNTPDILPESLQVGGRAAFMSRLVLAATLAGNYGIYGPPFEHGWSAPREPGSEEYLDSEKYQIHHHDLDRPDSLRHFISRVNTIRRSSPAIAHGGTLDFHDASNDQVICYSRTSADRSDVVLVIVSLDSNYRQSAWITLPLEELGLPASRPYQMHDLLTDARYLWHANRNYVELDPGTCPAHIFRVRRRTRTERDFEYYL